LEAKERRRLDKLISVRALLISIRTSFSPDNILTNYELAPGILKHVKKRKMFCNDRRKTQLQKLVDILVYPEQVAEL